MFLFWPAKRWPGYIPNGLLVPPSTFLVTKCDLWLDQGSLLCKLSAKLNQTLIITLWCLRSSCLLLLLPFKRILPHHCTELSFYWVEWFPKFWLMTILLSSKPYSWPFVTGCMCLWAVSSSTRVIFPFLFLSCFFPESTTQVCLVTPRGGPNQPLI